jgi:hypothetical protein
MRAWITIAGVLALAPILIGCGATCDRDTDGPTRFEKGTTDTRTQFYETSAWNGPYLDFPGGRSYQLVHGLPGRPREINIYLAFEENPLPSSNTAPAAGNQALIEKVDDEIIEIRNDTCSGAYVRVTASQPDIPEPEPPDPSGDSPDAGGEDGG